jgi:hypothetical protein
MDEIFPGGQINWTKVAISKAIDETPDFISLTCKCDRDYDCDCAGIEFRNTFRKLEVDESRFYVKCNSYFTGFIIIEVPSVSLDKFGLSFEIPSQIAIKVQFKYGPGSNFEYKFPNGTPKWVSEYIEFRKKSMHSNVEPLIIKTDLGVANAWLDDMGSGEFKERIEQVSKLIQL